MERARTETYEVSSHASHAERTEVVEGLGVRGGTVMVMNTPKRNQTVKYV